MQISLVAVAFALSFISAVAAQITPSAASASFIVSATAISEPYTVQRKNHLGAIIGGTVAGTLIVLVAVLLFVRYHMRRKARSCKIMHNGAGDAELGRRVHQLESEVRAMREQLDRLEAHRIAALPGYGTETAMYTHEEITMFKQGVDAKDEKVYPPKYVD